MLPKICGREAHGNAGLQLRHGLALPIYTLALLLDFASAGLSRLAAWIAGDAR
jgi:hypothetical protein